MGVRVFYVVLKKIIVESPVIQTFLTVLQYVQYYSTYTNSRTVCTVHRVLYCKVYQGKVESDIKANNGFHDIRSLMDTPFDAFVMCLVVEPSDTLIAFDV